MPLPPHVTRPSRSPQAHPLHYLRGRTGQSQRTFWKDATIANAISFFFFTQCPSCFQSLCDLACGYLMSGRFILVEGDSGRMLVCAGPESSDASLPIFSM